MHDKKIVVVTGGARGIGKAIVEKLSKMENMKIIANYNTTNAKELQEKLKKEGINIDIYKADITKKEEIQKLIDYTINTYKKIDILINNAGVDHYGLITDITDDEWEKVIKTNMYAPFQLSKLAVKEMLKNHTGQIINISSVWSKGAACEIAYSMTKAAINALTTGLAKEVGPSGIRVNAISPGYIDTDMNSNFTTEEKKEDISHIPLGRLGTPEDIAKAVQLVIECDYINGEIIRVDGGWQC